MRIIKLKPQDQKLLIAVYFIIGCIVNNTFAQQKWNLKQCVEYATSNNILIKQSKIEVQIAAVQYKQANLSKYPSANFNNNDALRFGKSQNPSTGILENRNFFSVGLGFQTSVEIFNWFSKRNTILANKWEMEAAKASADKQEKEIELSVINAYLQILLAKEEEEIVEVQVAQSNKQLAFTLKRVNAGVVPELNAVELETQVATDSANLISAKGNIEQTKYILKALMNIDVDQNFEINENDISKIPVESITDLQPEEIYNNALVLYPQQKLNDCKLKAANATSLAEKGSLYPTISLFGNIGTNYGYSRTAIFQQIFSGYQPSGLVVNNGSGGYTDVQRPLYINGNKTGYSTSDPLGSQFNYNFGQSIGINISIPIFNGWSAKANYEKSKLAINNQKLQIELDTKTLKQNIYQAYNATMVAFEKLNSSQKTVVSAQKSFDFATKRFNAGMLTTLELITDQNNLFKAKLELVLNQFDYMFKVKVLKFYNGSEF